MKKHLAVALMASALLASGCNTPSGRLQYQDAGNDLFIKANQCAAAELIRHLLPEQLLRQNTPEDNCTRKTWRGTIRLGGYGQSVGFYDNVRARNYSAQPPSTLMIATLADLDALGRTSRLGRVISEQVSATFTKTGYRMRELKLGDTLFIRQQGELMLTREVRQLAQSYDAQAVVVGTYAPSRDYLYVNLKVIHPQSNLVLAAHDYALPMEPNIRRMLRQ